MICKFTDGYFNGPATAAAVDGLRAELGFDLPTDYLDLLRRHNGGEGDLGDNYISLWKAEEIGRFNREYESQIYAPGIFFFGSNGAGEGYAFDIQDPKMPIVIVPFIGMSRRHALKAASNIGELFLEMAKRDLIHAGLKR